MRACESARRSVLLAVCGLALVGAAERRGRAVEPASAADVQRVCGVCHAYPPPELFAKRYWKLEVDQGFGLLQQSRLQLDPPSREAILQYYVDHAPDDLPIVPKVVSPTPCPCQFEKSGFRPLGAAANGAVSNVQFVHFTDRAKLDVLACDMRSNQLLLLKPYEEKPRLKVIFGGVPNPCHVHIVDLNGDGYQDLVVACLGAFYPTDNACGSVVWLRGSAAGTFTAHTLIDGVGRVADVRAADFNGDGQLDLIVAEFGWRQIGNIFLLENHTRDWSRPEFNPRTLDERHGAIHVPVVDLDGDGRPDFVALVSQEHETVVAFLNDGSGFRQETIYTAPQPAFGSSGIELVDLDGDGDVDVLLTNGDSLDRSDLRPWHSVSWLQNEGTYPFRRHELAKLYGVHRAVAADFDGDGDLDVIATSFLPEQAFGNDRDRLDLDSIVLLEQTSPGQFTRHSLETKFCDHATCDVGDFDGDGRPDVAIGNFANIRSNPGVGPGDADQPWLSIWRNVTPPRGVGK